MVEQNLKFKPQFIVEKEYLLPYWRKYYDDKVLVKFNWFPELKDYTFRVVSPKTLEIRLNITPLTEEEDKYLQCEQWVDTTISIQFDFVVVHSEKVKRSQAKGGLNVIAVHKSLPFEGWKK